MSRSQFSVEFIMLFTMAFLIFLIVVGFVTMFVDERRAMADKAKLDAFADTISQQIALVDDAGSSFEMRQMIPATLDGMQFDVRIENDVCYVTMYPSNMVVHRMIPRTYVEYRVGGYGDLNKGCNIIYKEDNQVKIDDCPP